MAPQADAGADATLTCTIDQLTLGGPGTTQNENVIYLWETNTGNFIGSNAIPDPDIDTPGDYTFTVTDTTNGCSTIDVVTISIDTIAPTADPGPDRQLDCNNPSIVLDASNSSTGIEFEYEWESLSGIIPDGATTTAPTIAIPDTYQLIVNNSVNGCADTALVEVVIDTLPPTVFLAEPDTLNCEVTEISLNATGSDSGFGFDFYWNIYEGGDIVSGADSFEPRVNATGRYEIVILNLENGCRDSLSVSVTDTINTLVADPGTAGILDCEITQINLDASASSGSNDMIYCWSTSDGHIVGDSNIVAIVVDEPGNYTLTVKDTVTMCRAINTIMVEQNTNFPEAEAGTSLTLNCRDTVHILEGSALNGGNNPGFSWTGPCIDSGADSPNPVVGCPGWYYLTVTNPDNNCEVTDSVEIFLNETTPVAHAGLPDTLTCTDSLLVLDAGLSEGDDLVFEWTGPGIVSGANSPNPEINIPGTYKVVVRNTQSFCQDSATVEIAIDTLPPQIDLVETDSVTCLESIITLGGTNTSIGPDFEYSWITNEGHIVGPADESTIEVDSAGVYGFFVTNIRNGCTSAEFAVVLADTLPPFANAGPDRELTCGSDSVLLNGTASASGDFITYEWSGDCIETSPFADSVWVGCTGIYTLTVNNTQNGCSASNEAEVSLNEQAPLAVLPDTAFISCETGNTQLDATGSVNGNLSWQFEGMPINLTGLMPTITETGTYSLIVNNPGLGCSDTASVLVLLDCQPIINIAIPDTLTCTVNTVMLDAGNSSSGAQYEYAWTAEDQSCIVNGADTPAPLVRCAGEYTLILTNVAVGLSDTMTVSVIATDETPNAEAGLPDTLNCIQLTTLLDGSASAADNPLNYLWTNLNGDTIAMTVMAEVSEPDVYLLEVTDQLTGCSDVDAVIISGNTAVPNISFSNNIVPCEADTIDIQAFVNPPGNYSYTWTGAGIISNPNNLNIQVDSANWFYLTVLNNANGCETQDSIQIRRQSCGPCVQIAIPDSITCNVQTVTLEGIICETCIGCDILWTTDDGTIDSQDGLIAVVSASGTYILTVTDPEGFSTEIEVEVTENREVPVADAGLDQNLNCRDSVLTLEGVLTSTGEHYRYL